MDHSLNPMELECPRLIKTECFATFRLTRCDSVNDRDGTFTVSKWVSLSCLDVELAFKSHSSPRPPQKRGFFPSLLIENVSDRRHARSKLVKWLSGITKNCIDPA
jgi:hypothetical protein